MLIKKLILTAQVLLKLRMEYLEENCREESDQDPLSLVFKYT